MDMLNELYDYGLVMYYSVYVFVIDRRKVIIEILQLGVIIGQCV